MHDSTPVHGKATLKDGLLTITRKLAKGELVTVYRVERLEPDPEIGFPAIRLHKLEGDAIVERYDVIIREFGPECCCQDYGRRQRECKHIRACRAAKLLETQ